MLGSHIKQERLITYYNRHSGHVEGESIYGERWLRLFYGPFAKKSGLLKLVTRTGPSRFYGRLMKRPSSAAKIAKFVDKYEVDTDEFEKKVDSFESFNDFFTRKLKANARPIDRDTNTATLPADGRHLGFENISQVGGIYAKGQLLNLETLLANRTLAKKYAQGSVLISRLCPVDYHRFHSPISGVVSTPKLINGPLYSVNPIALSKNIDILSQNKRILTQIKSDTFGSVLFLQVGATNVGSILHTYKPNEFYEKGQELGAFEFGGSMLITIFEPNTIELAEDLKTYTPQSREVYAKMGTLLGTKI